MVAKFVSKLVLGLALVIFSISATGLHAMRFLNDFDNHYYLTLSGLMFYIGLSVVIASLVGLVLSAFTGSHRP